MARIWCTNRTGIHPASSPITGSSLLGGSSAPYDSFNLGLKVGDDPMVVESHRAALTRACGLETISFMDQIHSALMLPIGDPIDSMGDLQRCDGLFMQRSAQNSKRALAVQVADCVPLILESEAILAAVHIGREGLIRGMTEAALEAIAERGDLHSVSATIGPSICGNCYPLSKEIFEICAQRYPASIHSSIDMKVDVAGGVISILESRGVMWDWFAGGRECVSCDRSYFSYRRDGVTGRQAMVVAW